MDPGLERAVAELYSVFGTYRASAEDDYCPHCVTPEEAAALRRARLPDLSAADLRRYATKAVSTWGSVEEFKHFLPRLLELVATREYDDAWLLANKFATCGRDWPEEEQAAVRDFFDRWLRVAPADFPGIATLHSLVPLVPILDLDLGSYLAEWGRSTALGTRRNIADLLTGTPHLGEPYRGVLERWLGGDAMATLLLESAEAAESAGAPEVAAEFTLAMEFYDHYRALRP